MQDLRKSYGLLGPNGAGKTATVPTLLCAFLSSFGYYLYQCWPTIGPGDSSELAAVPHVLGIAHPPGSPLYVIVGRVLSDLLPWGNPAYRVNLLSCLLTAAAVATIIYAIRRATGHIIPGVIAGIVLATARSVREQALVAELFALNVLFVTLGVLAMLNPSAWRGPRGWALVAFLIGIALGGHQMSVFLIPSLLLGGLIIGGRAGLRGVIRGSLIFLPLGAAAYLYLAVRASGGSTINWGDPRNWGSWLYMLLRGDYAILGAGREISVPLTTALLRDMAIWFPKAQFGQLAWWAFPLLVLGLISAWRRNRPAFWMTGLAALLSGPVFVLWLRMPPTGLNIAIIERFFSQVDVVYAAWCGLGAFEARSFLGRIGAWGARPFVALVMVLGGANAFWTGWSPSRTRENFMVRDFGHNVLRLLPKDGRILVKYELHFILQYLTKVEKARADIWYWLHSLYAWNVERLRRQYLPDFMPRLMAGGIPQDGEAVFAEFVRRQLHHASIYTNDITTADAITYPHNVLGLLVEVTGSGAPGNDEHRSTSDYSARSIMRFPDHRVRHVEQGLLAPFVQFYAEAYARLGVEHFRRGQIQMARSEFERAVAYRVDDWQKHYALGRTYVELQALPQAEQEFTHAIRLTTDSVDPKVAVGRLLAMQGRVREAQAMLTEALQRAPEHRDANITLGILWALQGRHREAVARFRQVLDHHPEDVEAQRLFAKALQSLKPSHER